MNALNNAEVGKYINEYFVAAFQKVATFKIVGGQKQGGNVAAYFCAPDGRVLNVVAGPVDAAPERRDALWGQRDAVGGGREVERALRRQGELGVRLPARQLERLPSSRAPFRRPHDSQPARWAGGIKAEAAEGGGAQRQP